MAADLLLWPQIRSETLASGAGPAQGMSAHHLQGPFDFRGKAAVREFPRSLCAFDASSTSKAIWHGAECLVSSQLSTSAFCLCGTVRLSCKHLSAGQPWAARLSENATAHGWKEREKKRTLIIPRSGGTSVTHLPAFACRTVNQSLPRPGEQQWQQLCQTNTLF